MKNDIYDMPSDYNFTDWAHENAIENYMMTFKEISGCNIGHIFYGRIICVIGEKPENLRVGIRQFDVDNKCEFTTVVYKKLDDLDFFFSEEMQDYYENACAENERNKKTNLGIEYNRLFANRARTPE